MFKQTIRAGIFDDEVSFMKVQQKSILEDLKMVMDAQTTYTNLIKSKWEKSPLNQKSKHDECVMCVRVLFTRITRIFLDTSLANEEHESGQDAVAAFDEAWDEFVECWKENAKTQPVEEELSNLKTSFRMPLETSINKVIETREKAVSQQADIHEKNEAKKLKKAVDTAIKEAKQIRKEEEAKAKEVRKAGESSAKKQKK